MIESKKYSRLQGGHDYGINTMIHKKQHYKVYNLIYKFYEPKTNINVFFSPKLTTRILIEKLC